MKFLFPRCRFFLPAIISLFAFAAHAQEKPIDSLSLYYPGPSKQDTTKYATIFVIRPQTDPCPDWIDAFFIQNFPMAKIFHNSRYVINCAHYGMTEMSYGLNNNTKMNITVAPEEKIYLRVTLDCSQKKPFPKMELLSKEEGIRAFDSVSTSPINIYDPDEMQMRFHGQAVESRYVRELNKRTGFNEFTFTHPISARHYFASPEMGYSYSYANLWVSPSYSEFVLIQRSDNVDFNSQEEFEQYVKMHLEKANKGSLKKSETVIENSFVNISTPADLSFASYFVTDDTKPGRADMRGDPFLEVRTWQAYLYKRQIKNNIGRIFQVTFTERGRLIEVHTKEEIFYKMNLLLQSVQFGKVTE